MNSEGSRARFFTTFRMTDAILHSPFTVYHHYYDRQKYYQEISIIIRPGKNSLPSERSEISCEIIEWWFDAISKIIQWPVADPREESREEELGSLSEEAYDDERHKRVDDEVQKSLHSFLLLLIRERVAHASRTQEDEEVSESVFDANKDVISSFTDKLRNPYSKHQQDSEADERIFSCCEESSAMFSMGSYHDDSKQYPDPISEQRKNFLILPAKNSIADDRYQDVVEDGEDEKYFYEFQHTIYICSRWQKTIIYFFTKKPVLFSEPVNNL